MNPTVAEKKTIKLLKAKMKPLRQKTTLPRLPRKTHKVRIKSSQLTQRMYLQKEIGAI